MFACLALSGSQIIEYVLFLRPVKDSMVEEGGR